MPVLRNIGRLVSCRFCGAQECPEVFEKAALVWEGGEVAWVGVESDLPEAYARLEVLDANGMMVIPGLVDCHTHLAFGGWRTGEFVQRALGAGYLEIARQGGGIRRTVFDTRRATAAELQQRCERFLDEMVGLGVTAVECKSGYGLDFETELRILEAYREVGKRRPVHLVPTLLAAHTIPPEYAGNRSAYVDLICREIIPAVADRKLARFCDVFVEESAFSIEEARRILESASRAGLLPRVHADQLTDCGGAGLAAEVEAASADHLERVSEEGIRRLATAGVVAVILPLAALYLRQPSLNARRLIDAGVGVAVATDFNPGSAPSFHLPLALTLACVNSGLTPGEALMGATWFAARSLRMESRIGSLEPGKAADFCLIETDSPEQWLYHFRANACRAVWIGGSLVASSEAAWMSEETFSREKNG